MFWRRLEFTVLYFGLPLLMAGHIIPFRPIPALLLCGTLALWVLLQDSSFDRSCLWNWSAMRDYWKRILVVFVTCSIPLGIAVYFLHPEEFLVFPIYAPRLWLLVMVLYPLFSVYPQELLFRALLFHRYSAALGGKNAAIVASAISFGFVHLIFGNWVAVVLSSIGGVLFALSYVRSNSLAVACVEHSLYGQFLFTVGLGKYFYYVPA